jgi:hypothetical protein
MLTIKFQSILYTVGHELVKGKRTFSEEMDSNLPY